MFIKTQFRETTINKEALVHMADYKFKPGMTISEVNEVIEDIKFGLGAFTAAPKYVLTRAAYCKDTLLEGEDNECGHIQFTLRVSAKYKLKYSKITAVFDICAGEDMFTRFIDEFIKFAREYEYAVKLEENLDALNAVVTDLIRENDIPFELLFSCGEKVMDISDTSIVVGLDNGVIESLSNLPLFNDAMPICIDSYREHILDTLKACVKPFDIFSLKTVVTKDLGVHTRKGVVKLIRKAVSRKIENIRADGVGYVNTDTVFGLVEKVAIREVDMKDYSGYKFYRNAHASSADKKKGFDVIALKFKLTPFDKVTLVNEDSITLETIVPELVTDAIVVVPACADAEKESDSTSDKQDDSTPDTQDSSTPEAEGTN